MENQLTNAERSEKAMRWMTENIKLVYMLLNKANRSIRYSGMVKEAYFEPKDYIGIAFLVCVKCLKYFDPSKATFNTYFGNALCRELFRETQYDSQGARNRSVNIAYSRHCQKTPDAKRRIRTTHAITKLDLDLEEFIYCDDDDLEMVEINDTIESLPNGVIGALTEGLPARKALAIKLRYVENQVHVAIGEALGVSKQRSDQMLDEAIEKMRHKKDLLEELSDTFKIYPN